MGNLNVIPIFYVPECIVVNCLAQRIRSWQTHAVFVAIYINIIVLVLIYKVSEHPPTTCARV